MEVREQAKADVSLRGSQQDFFLPYPGLEGKLIPERGGNFIWRKGCLAGNSIKETASYFSQTCRLQVLQDGEECLAPPTLDPL